MAAPVISISSGSSDEIIRSSIPRVILIGSCSIKVPIVPANLPVAPKVGAAAVASPAGILELDTHSSSESDPSKSLLLPVPVAPMVSPFLCLDDFESDTEFPERYVSSIPHDSMVAKWRSRVASRPSSPSRSSSPTTSTSKIATAPIPPAPFAIVAPSTDIISPIDAPPRIHQRRVILIRPGKVILVSRLYRTHLSRSCRALTARKVVGPIPSHRLALRYISHHLDRFTFGSSSDHSSFNHSSADYSPADHTSENSPSDSPATTPNRHSHSPPHSAGPSRKRDSISPKDSLEEDINADVLADIEADAMAVEFAAAIDVKIRIDAGIGIEVEVEDDREDEDDDAESSDRGTIEVEVDMVAEIDILDGQRHLEAESLIASKERAGLLDHVVALKRINARLRDTLRMESCQPLNIKGIEGVVGLTRLLEKMKTVFHISNCPEKYQVKEVIKLMTEVYYPRNKIQKMQTELWNLTMKGNDLTTYTQRFQELSMLYIKMVPGEEDQLKKFIGGLPDNIQENGNAAKSVENKRRLYFNQKDNHAQQPPYKRQNVSGQNMAIAYTAGNNERRGYAGPWPYCNKCKLHHERQCTVRCSNCKKGHYRSDCPKLKNQNRGNKTGNKTNKARGKAYVLGADRSFVSTTFSALLDAIPSTLDVRYAVELANGRVSETNTVLRGCTLGLLGHLFNIDLMLVELDSSDVIIGMDWLANHYAVIICDEKIIRIPYEDEVLIHVECIGNNIPIRNKNHMRTSDN
ncbi:putative reverse transcriptase domain-containing protein [Tanacetum coccineum]